LSSLPTSALSRYDLVGQGECQGSEPNSRYLEITISSDSASADENDCAALCNECVFGKEPGYEFRGFHFFVSRCACLVTENSSLVDTSATVGAVNRDCIASLFVPCEQPETGPITDSNGQNGVCYKIKAD